MMTSLVAQVSPFFTCHTTEWEHLTVFLGMEGLSTCSPHFHQPTSDIYHHPGPSGMGAPSTLLLSWRAMTRYAFYCYFAFVAFWPEHLSLNWLIRQPSPSWMGDLPLYFFSWPGSTFPFPPPQPSPNTALASLIAQAPLEWEHLPPYSSLNLPCHVMCFINFFSQILF
jgi:hypothetical protein